MNRANCTVSMVQMLINYRAPLDTIDIDNMTPLHYCVKFGHKCIMEMLLKKGVPINFGIHRKIWTGTMEAGVTTYKEVFPQSSRDVLPDSCGLTPLHFAALTGSPTMTRFLLDHSADPNALSAHGETPLHLTLRKALYKTNYQDDWNDYHLKIEHLWDNVDYEDDDTVAIVDYISQNRLEVLDVLLSDLRTRVTVVDCNGDFPIHCIEYNQPESIAILERLVSAKADPLCGNSRQQNALHLASRAGDIDSVNFLLSLETDLALSDHEGLNALHYAAQGGDYETMEAILTAAIVKSFNVVASKDKRGMNALHHLLSATSGCPQIETVQLLVRRGVDGSALNESEATPLACYLRGSWFRVNVDICQYLLGIKGNACFVDDRGQNLGHLCARTLEFGIDLAKVLKEYGVDMTKRDYEGKTVLHCAAICGSLTTESLEYLLSGIGVQLNAEDLHKKTALQYATEEAAKDTTGFLHAERWERTKDILLHHSIERNTGSY